MLGTTVKETPGRVNQITSALAGGMEEYNHLDNHVRNPGAQRMEDGMVCKLDSFRSPVDGVLVSHHRISVFTTTAAHLDKIQKKPDGHYDQKDLIDLVKEGHAVLYDEKAVRAIAHATEVLMFGCHPTE